MTVAATEAARETLEASNADLSDLSTEDVYDLAEPDATDAHGQPIVRFRATREGGVSFEISDGVMYKVEISDGVIYKGEYAPDRVMAERVGVREGIEAALSELPDYVDLRKVRACRNGVFEIDLKAGEVSAFRWTSLNAEGPSEEECQRLVAIANGETEVADR
jgi:hypothetical protein